MIRPILPAALLATSVLVAGCSGRDEYAAFSCDMFESHEEAQAALQEFRAHGEENSGLDSDGDGQACVFHFLFRGATSSEEPTWVSPSVR